MEQAMTREERRAELKALEARRATMAFAKYRAKKIIQAQIKARGDRLANYTNKDLILAAEAMLASHPELIVEAAETAKQLGYGV
jgi:hypothetical protein